VAFESGGGTEALATSWVSTPGIAGAVFGCGGCELPDGAVLSVLTCTVLSGAAFGLAAVDPAVVDAAVVDPAFVDAAFVDGAFEGVVFVGTFTMTLAGGARESREIV
jgi:hypothetical protein